MMSDKAGPGVLNLSASADSMYNVICHSSPFKVGVPHTKTDRKTDREHWVFLNKYWSLGIWILPIEEFN